MDIRQFLGMVSTEKAMFLDIALMNLFSSHHGTGRTWRSTKYEHVNTFAVFEVLLMAIANRVELCPGHCQEIPPFCPCCVPGRG